MNREELALETEHLDLLDRLSKAKAGGDRDELRAAKVAIQEFRFKWRTIRAAFASPEEGTATPDTLRVKKVRV